MTVENDLILRKGPDKIAGDRREDRRYPIERDLIYKLIHRKRVLSIGEGMTVDLSSGGILFESDQAMTPGLDVELSISWPVLLHGVVAMRLLITGCIVRNDENRTAIRIVQHEFRTQGGQTARAGGIALTASDPEPDRGRPLRVCVF